MARSKPPRPVTLIIPQHVQCEVIIFFPGTMPVVFESREKARAWAAQDERASKYSWHALEDPPDGEGDRATVSDDDGVTRSNEATRKFLKFAEENRLKPDSDDAFRRAHDEGVVRSVFLYSELGCKGQVQVVEDYLADWGTLGLAWTPQSCKCYGQGTLYANAYGKTIGGLSAPVSGSGCINDLDFAVQAVESV
jgi:hypothetical protein